MGSRLVDFVRGLPRSLVRPRPKLTWVNRGLVIARLGRRTLNVGGEALLEHNPDYVIYASYITHWTDGTPLGEDEKAAILDGVVAEAARRGWRFEIEWSY